MRTLKEDRMLTIVTSSEIPPDTRRGGRVQTLLSPRTVGSTSGFMGIATVEPGDAVAEHYHPYSEEFVYVVSGCLDLYADDERHALSAGQGVVLPINTRHRLVNAGTEDAQIVFHLGPLAPRPELGHVDTEHERLERQSSARAQPALERSTTVRPEADAESARVPRFWNWMATAAMGFGYATAYANWYGAPAEADEGPQTPEAGR
jgi:putative monooxygenase